VTDGLSDAEVASRRLALGLAKSCRINVDPPKAS